MKTILYFNLLFLYLINSQTVSGQDIKDISEFFKSANTFFKEYAVEGNIKYDALKNDRSKLKALTDFIASTPLKTIDKYKRKAYFINIYNLLVINGVLDKYPIPTVRDTDGFFKTNKHKVGKEMMTLDHLEYKVIFKEFSDPRLHFVLVCAAQGCPPIASFAYTPGYLTDEINKQCQISLDNPKFLYLEDKKEQIQLSPIFKWYKDDFFPSIVEFINAHKTVKLPKDYKLGYYEYNWKLNIWKE